MAVTSATPYIWYDSEALEAARFYVGLFPGSSLGSVSHYLADAQSPVDTVLTVEFEILGRSFVALNGGPIFPQSEAFSIQVSCETQADVDRVWDAIVGNGGQESQCGWCKDRWGVSWQVIPEALGRALQGEDGYDAKFAFEAMMQMRRIVVADLAPR